MRDSTTPRDLALANLAVRRHGVVSVAELRALGFDRYAIARRVRSGRLHRLHRGVYAVGHTVLGAEARYLAAVLACGEGAVLSHRTAAMLWGLLRSAAVRIDVTVSHTSGVRSTAAIAVHRSRRPVATTMRHAIPVTTPMQALADLATALPRRQLEKAAEMAEVLELLDVTAIDDDHPGARRLGEVLDEHDLETMTRSELEDAFLQLCDEHGIPRPLVNTHVEGFEVDFCWPEERLIVETDGRRHATRAAFEDDRARDALLTALRWRVMRFTKRRVRRAPHEVAALVISARRPLLVATGSGSG